MTTNIIHTVAIQTLTTTTSASAICDLKAIFSWHGIQAMLNSDNGPQYSSQEMKDFAQKYMSQAAHITLPQINCMAERMLMTAKSILEKSADPYLALLADRKTLLPSLAQLSMGRSLRTDILQVP